MDLSLRSWAVLGVVAGLVSACGGSGGGGSGSSSSTPLTPPTVSEADSTLLTPSSQTAADLVAAVRKAASGAATVSGFSGVLAVSMTAPVQTAVAPKVRAAALEKQSEVNCAYGGKLSRRLVYSSDSQISAGDAFSFTYTDCATLQAGSAVHSGSTRAVIDQFQSDRSWSFSYTATDLVFTEGAQSLGPYSFGGYYVVSGDQVTWSYSTGEQTVIGDPDLTRSGTTTLIGAGKVRTRLYGGVATVSFSNWRYDSATQRADSGSADVAGSSGHTARVSVTAQGYAVEIRQGDQSGTFVVPF